MRSLCRAMAAPWPGLQFANGTYPDYLHHDEAPASTRYGEAMLGYGLLMTGVRENDDALIDAGLRGVNWFVAQTALQRDHPSVFANAAVASAYNFARAHVTGRPLFDNARDDWETWLRRAKLLWLPDSAHYANKYLVEVVAVLELLDTGLDSDVPGSVLAHDATAKQLAEDLINSKVPAMADAGAFAVGDKRAYFLSDPEGGNPLAYQGLSFGLYGRAVQLLGDRASDAAKTTLRLVAQASWGLMGPDGDVAYHGRSQEQAWTLGLTANGAEAAIACADASAASYHPMAQRALVRLRDAYGVGRKGLYLTPSLREDMRDRLHGVDTYAGVVGYSGLTLVACNWATDLRDDEAAPAGDGGEGAYDYELNPLKTGFAVVRRGDLWFAVRAAAKTAADDLRYDFGLVALKTSAAGRGWVDVVRPRPHTRTGPDSAGPVLRRSAGVGLPEGERLDIAADGTVTVTGGFRTVAGEWLRRGVRFRFQPHEGGVRLIFPTEQGDRIKYSVFFDADGDEHPTVGNRSVSDGNQRVTFAPDAEVAFDAAGYASGRDAALVRANLFFKASDGGPVHIVVKPT
jgi:hypothetical protein